MYCENIDEVVIFVVFDLLFVCYVVECGVVEGFGDFLVCSGVVMVLVVILFEVIV